MSSAILQTVNVGEDVSLLHKCTMVMNIGGHKRYVIYVKLLRALAA